METLFWTFVILAITYSIMMVFFFFISFINHKSGSYRIRVDAFRCEPKYKKWVNFIRWSWRKIWIPFEYSMMYGEGFKETCAKINILYDKNNKGCTKNERDEKDMLL